MENSLSPKPRGIPFLERCSPRQESYYDLDLLEFFKSGPNGGHGSSSVVSAFIDHFFNKLKAGTKWQQVCMSINRLIPGLLLNRPPRLGPATLAAQSIVLVSESMTFQVPFSLSVAASVRIGNLLGEGNAKRASVANKTALLMSLLMASVLR